MTNDVVFMLVSILFLVMCFMVVWQVCVDRIQKKKENTNKPTEQQPEKDYVEPQLKPLTAEQIAEIHSRGKITPAEAMAEWESLDLCAPGDGMGGAAWRCRKFGNCYDCLIDFANEQDEYTSIYQRMREVNITNQDTNFRI